MRTINVYSFNELSEEAKAKAIENARAKGRHWDMEFNTSDAVDSIKAAAAAFQVTLGRYSIGSDVQRMRCDIYTNSTLENEEIEGQRLRTWLINHHHDIFYKRKTYGESLNKCVNLWGVEVYQYQRHSNILFEETDCPFTGVFYDDIFLDTFRKFLKKPWSATLEDLFKDGVHDVCKALEEEEEYQQSDDGITDYLECNAEFTEEGEFI